MTTVSERLRATKRSDDAGSTLMELLVGMTLMAVFMTVFTTAVYSMSRTVNKVEAVTISAGQVNQAFLKLDKLVRYASAVAPIGQSSTGAWYVELDNTATAPETCTQLRIDKTTGQLQQRTWTITNATVSAASAWRMLANQITNASAATGSSDQPFSVPSAAATANSPFQQLTVTLVVQSGGATSSTSRSKMTFTALNSVASAATNATTCQQKGRP